MREGQRMAWQQLPVRRAPVLPGTLPVLRWFAAERGHAGATHIDVIVKLPRWTGSTGQVGRATAWCR